MIKVVIADDSAFTRTHLEELFRANAITVVATVENGAEAVRAVKQFSPDVAILDYEMPIMDGITALETIMRDTPIPVIIFSAYTPEGAIQTLRAIAAGAQDVIVKPAGDCRPVEQVEEEIVASVRCAAAAGLRRKTIPRVSSRRTDVICVGSSAGGVFAAGRILPALPADIPPLIWVQHMPADFMEAFTARLDSVSKITVKIARHGERLRPGVCYMPPTGYECGISRAAEGCEITLSGCKPESRYCPSCDGIFESAAQVLGEGAVGVILSGIGNDGTAGLVGLHSRGGFVIGQSESSCVVYGMPRAAIEAGAVDMVAHLDEIAPLLCNLAGVRAA